MERVCLKCGEKKGITEFNFKDKAKGRRNARCKECTRADIRAAYRKNRKYYLRYRAEYNRAKLRTRQEFLFSYLKDKACIDCGVKNPVVLHFDHVRGKKIGNISDMLFRRGRSMKVIFAEIAKCEIRCANCHAKKTAKEKGYYAFVKQPFQS